MVGIKSLFKAFFENRFREEDIIRPVLDGVAFKTISDNDFLTALFLVEEVKEVVWDCDGNKSLGPYGFNLNFFKHYWNLVEKDVMGFMAEFMRTGWIPKDICGYGYC